MSDKTKVYDLPTRLFHWIFAGLFLTAFIIAKVIDDDSPNYVYHMFAGFILSYIVLLRVFWGLLGSKYARFSSFKLNPTDLISYFKSLVSSKTPRVLGHNPASSFAAVIMMLLTLVLGVTGFLMTKGINKHFFEDVHELAANAFVLTAIGHVVGVIFHQIKHRDLIGLSMITGNKLKIEGEEGISKNYILAAIVFIVMIFSFVYYLNTNYNSTTQKLNLFGTQLQLGEAEEGQSYEGKGDDYGDKDHKDDED